MNEMPTREQWRSSAGFVLATIGCAAGLGNIWRFSYVAGENGGAAFLLIYIACVALIGVPLMLAEFCIGRRGQADVVVAFSATEHGKHWRWAGRLMALASIVLLSYYAVIAGWACKYFIAYVLGTIRPVASGEFGIFFDAFVTDPLEPVLWQVVVVGLTVTIVAAGVQRGIENINKYLMPALALLVMLLAAYALSLEGAGAGVRFLFRPEWSALRDPAVYVAAGGQAFFSLGIGAGALLTYGSYTGTRQRLAPAAVTVAAGDSLFAVIAGLAIFPAVFAFELDPAQGPMLAFVILPEVFNVLPGGRLFAVAFFLLLGLAALTSAVSLLEVPAAALMRRLHWSRKRSALVTGIVVLLLGLPSALGFGLLGGLQVFGMGVLEVVDRFASTILLPLGGFLIAAFVGWIWLPGDARRVAGLEHGLAGRGWLFLVRFVAPVSIAVILAGMVAG